MRVYHWQHVSLSFTALFMTTFSFVDKRVPMTTIDQHIGNLQSRCLLYLTKYRIKLQSETCGKCSNKQIAVMVLIGSYITKTSKMGIYLGCNFKETA